jgi:hypothetical protein
MAFFFSNPTDSYFGIVRDELPIIAILSHQCAAVALTSFFRLLHFFPVFRL